jgi:ABC-2 type transport system permease protein
MLSVACFVLLIIGAYVLVMGPQFARQDIRSDMPNADILKTYPLRGWQVVLGEILTPVAILTGILWLIVLAVACGFRPHNLPWLTPQMRITLLLWLTLLVPLVATLQMLIPNAAALVFPVWFQATRRRGGPEVAGQRMIFFFAQILTTVIALLPSVLLGGVLWFIVHKLTGWEVLAVNLAAAPVVLALVGEIWCGIWLLGERFENLDLSLEVRP